MRKYYIEDNGATVRYGLAEEIERDHPQAIQVEDRPSRSHKWNGSSWAITEDGLREQYQAKQRNELERIEKYHNHPNLIGQQIASRNAYRNALWNLDFSDTQNFSFPECPEFMQE